MTESVVSISRNSCNNSSRLAVNLDIRLFCSVLFCSVLFCSVLFRSRLAVNLDIRFVSAETFLSFFEVEQFVFFDLGYVAAAQAPAFFLCSLRYRSKALSMVDFLCIIFELVERVIGS